MHGAQLRLTRCVVGVLSLFVIVAVAFLPWRDVGIGNPFHLGAHLYQMGLPVLTAGLVVLALTAAFSGYLLDRGDWPTRLVTASGMGIVVLVLLVQQSAATGVLAVSTWHIHTGNAVAIGAGGLIALIGVSLLFLRTKSSRGTTSLHP